MEQQNEHISNQYQDTALAKQQAKPLGEVMVPAVMCGAAGAVLTIILAVIGWYDGMNADLKAYFMAKPFYMQANSVKDWTSTLDIVLAMFLCLGISFAVLDTDKQWRRVMLILLLFVVVIFSSPVLMLWDVFWSPVTVLIGVLWSWICAYIYSCQHRMPCENIGEIKIQSLPLPIPEAVKEAEDPSNEKYQPKSQPTCPD